MPLIVAVDVAPSASAPRETAALLESCTRALPSGSCRSAEEVGVDQANAAASVIWSDEWHAHIQVRLHGVALERFERELTFSRDDARLERFRSVGLAIATIVDQSAARREDPSAAPASNAAVAPTPESAREASADHATTPIIPTPSAQGTPKPTPERGARARRPRAAEGVAHAGLDSVEAGGVLGTGLVAGPARIGVYARAAHDVSSLPMLVDVAIAYAVLASGTNPSLAWTDLKLGSGLRLAAQGLRFELGVSALLSRTTATATHPVTHATDTRGLWLPGVALGGRVAWPERGPVSVALGTEACWLSRKVRFTNVGQNVGRVAAVHPLFSAGARLSW